MTTGRRNSNPRGKPPRAEGGPRRGNAITRDLKTSDAGKANLLRKLAERTLGNLSSFVALAQSNAAKLRRADQEIYSVVQPPKDESDMAASRREIRADRILANYEDGNGANAAFLGCSSRNVQGAGHRGRLAR